MSDDKAQRTDSNVWRFAPQPLSSAFCPPAL
jgi:hypothetical protein